VAFHVFTGGFPELEDHLLAELRRKDPLEPVLLIARSRRLLRRLQARLADPVILNVHGATLEQAAERLAMEADDGCEIVRDPLVLEKLLLELIRDYFPGAVYLSRAIRSHKTAGALLQTILDLKQADLPLEQLPAVIADRGFAERDRLAEIFRLTELYEKALQIHRIHDPDDLLRLAARRAAESRWLASIKKIFIYGFYDLNQLQWNFVERLARARDTRMHVPLGSGPAFEFARRFFERYVSTLCGTLAGTVEKLPGPDRFEDRLFEEEIRPHECRIAIVNASGRHDEVWFAAKRVVRMLQRGVAPSEIAVIARTLEPYAPIISAVFRDNRIPYVTSARESIRAWPLVRAVETLFDLPELDYERSAVLQVLSSGYFAKPDGSDPALWNLATSLLGIGRGERAWLGRLDAAIAAGGIRRKREDADSPVRVGSSELKLLRDSFARLVRALGRLPPRATWTSLTEAAVEILRELMPESERLVPVLRELEMLENVWLGRPVERREFVSAVIEKLERTRLPAPGNFAGVSVLDAMSARGLLFRHAILLGVNERVFPRFVAEEPFVNDHNRAMLSATLGCKLDTRQEAFLHEKLLFATALGCASEETTLSYQRADDEGRVLSPSTFLREVAYRLPQAQGLTFDEFVRRHVPQCERVELARSPEWETLTPAELFLRTDDPAVFERFAADGPMLRRALEAVRDSETADALGPRDGAVGSAIEPFWTDYRNRVSPTFLETYSLCPMKALLSRVLALEPFERPEEIEQAAPVDLGNLAHAVLAGFYERFEGGDPEPVLDAVWNEVFAEHEARAFVRYPLVWELQTRKLRAALRTFLLKYDLPAFEWNPIVSRHCEVSPPHPVAIPGIENVRFQGTLDRLFVLEDGTGRVDDYKWKVRGAGQPTAAALGGRHIQLAIYTRLAQSIAPEARRIRAGLILLRAIVEPRNLSEALGERAGIYEPLPEDFWSAVGPRFAANISSLVSLIGSGAFFIVPESGERGVCSWCDFSSACRKSHYPTAVRPREDPSVRSFWQVREDR
jgi:ATP-dependent helicase/nuclease subunit B